MACKDCIHNALCVRRHFRSLYGITGDGCEDFKDKSRLVELPCNIGDKLWWCCDSDTSKIFDEDPGIGVYEDSKPVQALVWDGEKWSVLIDGDDVVEIGSQYAHLSKESAERWMNERSKDHG